MVGMCAKAGGRGPGIGFEARGRRLKLIRLASDRWENGIERHTEPGTGAAMAQRESIARGKKKDIVCFLKEKRAKMVGERKERTVEIQTKAQLKYSGARDCGIEARDSSRPQPGAQSLSFSYHVLRRDTAEQEENSLFRARR